MPDEPTIPVYVALVEVRPLDGCELDPDAYGGAAVRCYVATDTEENAIARIAVALDERRFEVVDVNWCVDEAVVQWEKPDDRTGAAIVSEARASNDVVFGEFHTWEPE